MQKIGDNPSQILSITTNTALTSPFINFECITRLHATSSYETVDSATTKTTKFIDRIIDSTNSIAPLTIVTTLSMLALLSIILVQILIFLIVWNNIRQDIFL